MKDSRDIVIGGENFCRICGTSHSCAISHPDNKISGMQKAQMAVEEIEKAVSEVYLKSHDRFEMEMDFKQLRMNSRILDNPIYLDWTHELAENIFTGPEAENFQKSLQKELKALEYKPSEDQLARAKELLEYIQERIEAKAMMKGGEEKQILAVLEKTRKELGIK